MELPLTDNEVTNLLCTLGDEIIRRELALTEPRDAGYLELCKSRIAACKSITNKLHAARIEEERTR